MEQPASTSGAAVVTAAASAELLLDPQRLRFLRPFMLAERSTSAAAAEVGVSVKDMAYRVKRMAALGLLSCTREQRRAGRPVRFYRAPGAYFVPFATVPEADLEEMLHGLLRGPQRQLVRGLVQTLADTERDLHHWGWRLELDTEERVSVRPVEAPDSEEQLFRKLLNDEGPAVYMANLPLRLSHADGKRLQRELVDLVERYDSYDGPDTYILTLGLTPSKE